MAAKGNSLAGTPHHRDRPDGGAVIFEMAEMATSLNRGHNAASHSSI
jgi:hypothetical protein